MSSDRNYRKFLSQARVKNGVYYAFVKLVPQEERRALRYEFENVKKKPHSSLYDYHHKIPLSLGGDNSQGNLVLMLKYEHTLLHKYIIDPQIKDLSEGEYRRIMLPVMNERVFSFSSDSFRHFLKEFSKMGLSRIELYDYMDTIGTRDYINLFAKEREL